VRGLKEIRLEVRVLPILERHISGVRIGVRSDDAADVGEFRNVGKLFNLAPVLAAVFGDLNQTVVGADIDQAFLLWRFSKRGSVAKESRRSILGYGIDALNLSHHRQLVAIQTARKLAADHLPTVAAIVAAEKFVGGKVKPRVRVWTDDERRVPIPTQRLFTTADLRRDTQTLAGSFVIANQIAVLQLGIARVRI